MGEAVVFIILSLSHSCPNQNEQKFGIGCRYDTKWVGNCWQIVSFWVRNGSEPPCRTGSALNHWYWFGVRAMAERRLCSGSGQPKGGWTEPDLNPTQQTMVDLSSLHMWTTIIVLQTLNMCKHLILIKLLWICQRIVKTYAMNLNPPWSAMPTSVNNT